MLLKSFCNPIACVLDLLSYGYLDTNGMTAALRINSVTAFSTTYSGLPFYRGVIMSELNLETCTVVNTTVFDTNINSEGLVAYIQRIQVGRIMVAITADEPYSQLGAATSTLTSLGLDLSPLNYRGKFAFVTQIGSPSKTVSLVKPSRGTNAHIGVRVQGIKIFTEFCSIIYYSVITKCMQQFITSLCILKLFCLLNHLCSWAIS